MEPFRVHNEYLCEVEMRTNLADFEIRANYLFADKALGVLQCLYTSAAVIKDIVL